MAVLCQIKELGLGCFGCCGRDFSNKKKIMRDVKQNNRDLKNNSLSRFMSRSNELKPSGICANLVYEEGRFFCPGHPYLNNGRDYRNLDPDCEKDFVCRTYGLFQKWDAEKQEKFVEFIKEKVGKGMKSYEYSIKMDNGSLLKEFEKRLKAGSL